MQGSSDAEALGLHLRDGKSKIDLVISSPAKRARETTELVLSAAQLTNDVRYDPRIYEATSHDLLGVISEIEPQHQSAMVVGHNPGMEDLLRMLTGRLESMSTTTLAEIEIDTEAWSNVSAGKCILKRIVSARELLLQSRPESPAG